MFIPLLSDFFWFSTCKLEKAEKASARNLIPNLVNREMVVGFSKVCLEDFFLGGDNVIVDVDIDEDDDNDGFDGSDDNEHKTSPSPDLVDREVVRFSKVLLGGS